MCPLASAGGIANIVGGQPTPEWAGIGALVSSAGNVVCTGTLIGPSLVLTAAHCVDAAGPQSERFVTGASVDEISSDYAIIDVIIHPDYVNNGSAYAFDLALVRVDGPTVEDPLAVRTTPPSEGMDVIIAGYGLTDINDPGSNGDKHRGDTTVSRVFQQYLQISGLPQACVGDSGGPMFVESTQRPVVLGVANFTTGPQCEAGANTYYQRVDTAAVMTLLDDFPGVCHEGVPCDIVFANGFDR